MKKLWIVILSGWLVTLGAGIAQAQSGYDLFQKALAKERAEGNIREAIQLYQRIVREHAANRTLTAKALVQMGQCYEKLGKAEARRAYERVVRDYADQPEQAAEARVRLAALAPPPNRTNGSMLARRVWAGPELNSEGALSPDARFLTFVDWETGDLAVRDLAAGEKRRLTNKGSWQQNWEFADASIISSDGRQVAYVWFNGQGRFDLRLMGLEGGSPRVLYRNEDVRYLRPAEWSPDGKHILTLLTRNDNTNQMALIAVVDGSARVLKTLDWRSPLKMSFSPDGRYIAYDFPPRESSANRDIFLLAADGSRQVSLVQHPANDLSPVWAPDGKRVVFTSDRTGTMGVWSIAVADGKPQGDAELGKSDIGRSLLVRFTQKGSLYYNHYVGMQNVYTATLEAGSGPVLAPPARVSELYFGANSAPDWSPDGQYLAYTSRRGFQDRGPGSKVIVIRSLETGEERELAPQLQGFSRPRWSPDGRSFLATGTDSKGRQGAYRIEARTGESALIVQSPPGTYIGNAIWARDGKAIFYGRSGSVLRRELETGEEKVVPQVRGANMALSSDGRWLAFTYNTVLKVMPVSGGEPRELLSLKESEKILGFSQVAWTADGRYLLFVKNPGGPQHERAELWRISVEGGEPERLGVAVPRLRELSVHPDGRRIAFTAGENKVELWSVENFLPVLRAAK